MNRPSRIVSGGQTGVDRAALDAAIALGIPHGGWCPRGRLSENGRIPARYRLRETESSEYWVRTKQNVRDSDATLILCRGEPSGGTELTLRIAAQEGRPYFVVDLEGPAPLEAAGAWLAEHRVEVLNVAGPRESQNPGIGEQATEFLERLLAQQKEKKAKRKRRTKGK